MKSLVFSALVFFGLSTAALADPVTIALKSVDGMNFKKMIYQFSNPETVLDSNAPGTWRVIRTHSFGDGALAVSCSTQFLGGTGGLTDCSLTFDLSKSSSSLELAKAGYGNAIFAKFKDPNDVLKLSSNISHGLLSTSEKLSVQIPNGSTMSLARASLHCDGSAGAPAR